MWGRDDHREIQLHENKTKMNYLNYFSVKCKMFRSFFYKRFVLTLKFYVNICLETETVDLYLERIACFSYIALKFKLL